MKKKIYLSAPLSAGNLKNHLSRFLRYAGYTMKEGALPVAVHFYAFSDADAEAAAEENGLKISFEERFSLIWFCDEMWVFGPVITKEMEREIEFCANLGMKVRYITEKEVTKKIGEKKS